MVITRRRFATALGAGVLAAPAWLQAGLYASADPARPIPASAPPELPPQGLPPQGPTPQEPTPPQALRAQSSSAPTPTLGPGTHPLKVGDDRDGLIYVPKGAQPGVSLPLFVTLHGAGGSAEDAEATFPLADAFGFVVLAPESREWTWDVLLFGYGPDVEFIRDALKATSDRCAIDRQRVTLAGVSDGASYALSLGIGNGDSFGHLIAFSPGIMRPADARGKPRIFISHGTKDAVMPIAVTSRVFVPRLKALGYDVTYEEFDGGHTVPPTVRRHAFEWLGRG